MKPDEHAIQYDRSSSCTYVAYCENCFIRLYIQALYCFVFWGLCFYLVCGITSVKGITMQVLILYQSLLYFLILTYFCLIWG